MILIEKVKYPKWFTFNFEDELENEEDFTIYRDELSVRNFLFNLLHV